ncbi:retrovirus-related pol polyprotein from transposon TNT 1-94, partial [Tanacetum coccineum]
VIPSSEQSNVVNHSETEITSDSNIIPYSQYVTESQQAAVQNSNSSIQQDALILSVIEHLKTQVANCTKINMENKIINDTLTVELERYKEQSVEIDRLKQTLSEHLKEKESLMQTVSLLKDDFKKEESRNIDREIALEKRIKQLDNIVFKRDQSAQTVHMLTKPQFFYDHTTKQALGFQNPFYLKKAQQLEPKLYVGDIIEKTNPIVIPDSEETLMLAEESRSKMLLKQKDPIMLEKKVNTTPVDYARYVNSLEATLSSRPTKVEVPKELPKVSMVNTSLKKLKYHLAGFNMVVKERTTPTAITEGSWGDNFVLNQNAPNFDQLFELNELKAQSQEKDTVIKKLKERIKSLSGKMNKDKIKKDLEEIETINIELNHRMSKLIAENEHLKQTYKQLYDSIKPARIRSKEQCGYLINQVNLKSMEIFDLSVSLQEKVLVITALKDDLIKLKGKSLVDNDVTKHPRVGKRVYSVLANHNLQAIQKKIGFSDPPSSTQKNKVEAHPRTVKSSLKNNNCVVEPKGTAHVQHSKLNANSELICVKITTTTEVPLRKPTSLDNETSKPAVILVYSRKPRKSKTNVPVSKSKVLKSISANKKEPSRPYGFSRYLDSGYSKHMTRDRSQLINFVNKFLGTVKFRNDHMAKILGYGDYQIGNVMISRVYYVEGLGHNLFSVGQFCDSNHEVAFRQHSCFIHNLEGVDLLTGSRGNNLYTLSLRYMMVSSPICLLSKASKTKSWLWHRCLSHLNFGAINHLARHSLVRGLPKLKFEKDHMCSACAMGKSKKKPHKPKSEDTNQEKLYLLHMDLCGPMRVASVNGKKYILVIVEDYSRFTWFKCLKSKDEAPDFIIKFFKMIQKVGISHETFVARSPQQNGVVERRNRTLIKVARTMLIYAIVPLFLWAEVVATACYTQNRSIVRLRHGKTPYELLHDKLPDLSFFHYFDDLTAMASEHSSSGPALHEMTHAIISSGLVPNPPPSTPFVPPSRTNWDLLFQPLFDELLTPPPSVDFLAPEVIALIAEVVAPESVVSTGSPSSTTVDQDAPSPNVAHMNNDPFFGIHIPENEFEASSSLDVIPTVVQSDAPYSEHITKWTKDHPLDNIIGKLKRPVSTRLQLHEQALFCYYDAFLSSVEPKTC